MCRAYILLRIIINYCFIFLLDFFLRSVCRPKNTFSSWIQAGKARAWNDYMRGGRNILCAILLFISSFFFVMYGYELYSAFENSHMNSKVIKWNNLRHQKITNLLREMSATIYIKEILPQHELKLNVSCYFHTRRIR